MWSECFALLVMATLLRVSYELSQSKRGNPGSHAADHTALTPQQKEWAEKAVRRYAEAQEKKWRRWNEAMFEAKISASS